MNNDNNDNDDSNNNDKDIILRALDSILGDMLLKVTADMLVMKASHTVLVQSVLGDLAHRGVKHIGHPDLVTGFQAEVSKMCERVLADYADSDPNTASRVKRLVDEIPKF